MPTPPTANDLQARFPAFAAVADATVELWITDAQTIVAADWIEDDYSPAIMELAAHNMALLGPETETGAAASLPAGVTRFRSGSLDVSISDAAASASAKGGLNATVYGRMFSVRLRRNRASPIAIASPVPARLGYWPEP